MTYKQLYIIYPDMTIAQSFNCTPEDLPEQYRAKVAMLDAASKELDDGFVSARIAGIGVLYSRNMGEKDNPVTARIYMFHHLYGMGIGEYMEKWT